MAVLPAISAVALTIATGAIGIPVAAAMSHSHLDGRIVLVVAGAAVAWPITFLSAFLNVAFLAMVLDEVENGHSSVREGLAYAWQRRRTILAWSLLATAVGIVLRILQQLPGVGGIVGGIISFVGSLAWGLATFFVLPVLVMERRGAVGSVKRSAHVFRERWGETVIADIGIGAATMIFMIPGFIALMVAFVAADDGNTATMVTAGAIAVLLIVPPAVWSVAVTQLFQLFAYRETTMGVVDGPFSARDIDMAIKPKKSRRWFRRDS
jgi:hypothetical protein